MERTEKAKHSKEIKLTLEFLENGIIATVPTNVAGELSAFGIEAGTDYRNKKTIITNKAQLLELISSKYFEFYEDLNG